VANGPGVVTPGAGVEVEVDAICGLPVEPGLPGEVVESVVVAIGLGVVMPGAGVEVEVDAVCGVPGELEPPDLV
jgi:hypothetical protein